MSFYITLFTSYILLGIYGLTLLDLDNIFYTEFAPGTLETEVSVKIVIFWFLLFTSLLFLTLLLKRAVLLDLYTISITGIFLKATTTFLSGNAVFLNIFNVIKLIKNITLTEKEAMFFRLKGEIVTNNMDIVTLSLKDTPEEILNLKKHTNFEQMLTQFLNNYHQPNMVLPVVQNNASMT